MLEVSGRFGGQKDKKLLIVGGAIIAVLLGVASYFTWQYFALKNDPTAANKETINRVVGEVSKVLQVPTDEEPQVAKVTDPSKIKDKPFFTNVEQDDYVIIYQKAQLAILYREKNHKLINVDYVELGPATQN